MAIVKSIDIPAFKGTIINSDSKHGSDTENSVNVGEVSEKKKADAVR